MAEKPKVAFYWAASCGGCEIAVLDLNEAILEVAEAVDIVFWPVAMDIKYGDVEAMPDGHIDITFFNGSIRNSEQEHMAKLLRAKSKTLIAFGACANDGSVPGLANLKNAKEILDDVYLRDGPRLKTSAAIPRTTTEVKEGTLEIPRFYDTVHTLDQIVDVDYYLPGCPPPVALIKDALRAILTNQLPPNGTVLAPLPAVCDQCSRKRENKMINHIYRIHEIIPDPERCLMEQGIICMGMATRSGCGAQCLKVDMPCTGCGGATPNQPDVGAGMITSLASILVPEEGNEVSEKDVAQLIKHIKDPVGIFYLYSLPSSIMQRKVMK